MGAMGGRALAPMFLHPLQYGVANLGKAYFANLTISRTEVHFT